MTDMTDAERLAQAGWREHARHGFMGLVGPLWSRREADHHVFGVVVTDAHVNPAGMIHGGMLATLLDQSVSTAAWEAGQRQPCVTVQLDTHFIAAVRPGAFLEARARVLRATSSLVFVQSELRVDSNTVATGMATLKIVASIA